MKTILAYAVPLFFIACSDSRSNPVSGSDKLLAINTELSPDTQPVFDTAAYDKKLLALSNGDSSGRWPAKASYPLAGAILPEKRIIAYYGNLYSTRMGILGEVPRDSMFKRLKGEIKKWNEADPSTPAIPALHYIVVTAQSEPGKAKKYRLRMPFHQVDTILNWAKQIDALVFLDIQVGWSNLKSEVPELEKFFALPKVHLGIDPEFAMPEGKKPGSVVGSFSAAEINSTINYLSGIVRKYNLPPKILVIHRFTENMVKDYQDIKPTPEVQVVMHMDGWGPPANKVGTYKQFVGGKPVQFAGFKIFYKNDTKVVKKEMQPGDLLKLKPMPSYIQYQ